MTRTRLRELIERNSMPIPFTDCWMWIRGYGSHGYGALRLPGAKSMTTAPRVAFEAWHGPLRKNERPRHTCHQKWCCNPDHLRRGTHTENMADKFRDGTSAWWDPKVRDPLVVDEVLAVRAEHAAGMSSRQVAAAIGITRQAVMDIVNYRSWSHL